MGASTGRPGLGSGPRFAVLALMVATSFLSSCAVMSEDECAGTAWYQKGLADGSNGLPASRADSYVRICSRAGVGVDVAAYYRGREQGLTHYCTAQRGREEGLRGGSYQHVCPAPLEAQFLPAYQQGRAAYDARQRLQRLNSDIDTQEGRLRKAKDSRERRRIRQHIRELDSDAAYQRRQLRQAESALSPLY